MQSSSRFCRKNGVCGISMHLVGGKKEKEKLFLRWKINGKNPVAHSRISPSASSLSNCTTGERESENSEIKGTLQQVSCQLPQSTGLFSFLKIRGSQVAIPKWQLCVHYYLMLYHYTKSQQTFAQSAAEVTSTAVLDTCLWNKQLYQEELKHESSALLLKQLRCLWTILCCLQTNATLLEQDCMLCCQQFSHCHSFVSAIKQSLTLKTLKKTQIVKKLSKSFHILLLNWLWLSKLSTWLQCPSGHNEWETVSYSPSPKTV